MTFTVEDKIKKTVPPDINYENREAIRRPHGHFSIVHPDSSMAVDGDTLQCCHCGVHWIPVKGSGIKRGFCRNCMQVTCGRPECNTCVPQEKMLEIIERKAGIVNSIRG